MQVYASEAVGLAQHYVAQLNSIIIFPLIILLTAVATVYFLYGAFEFIANASNEQGREKGKKHILWGLVGLLVMLSAWAILSIVLATFGIDPPQRIGNQSPFAPSDSPLPAARPAERADGVAPAATPDAPVRPVAVDPAELVAAAITESTLLDDADRDAFTLLLSESMSEAVRIETLENLRALGVIDENIYNDTVNFVSQTSVSADPVELAVPPVALTPLELSDANVLITTDGVPVVRATPEDLVTPEDLGRALSVSPVQSWEEIYARESLDWGEDLYRDLQSYVDEADNQSQKLVAITMVNNVALDVTPDSLARLKNRGVISIDTYEAGLDVAKASEELRIVPNQVSEGERFAVQDQYRAEYGDDVEVHFAVPFQDGVPQTTVTSVSQQEALCQRRSPNAGFERDNDLRLYICVE